MTEKLGVIFLGLFLLITGCSGGDGGSRDTDGDSLEDIVETQVYGTNPYHADTDGDGRSDGEEVSIGTDPLASDYARTLTLNRLGEAGYTRLWTPAGDLADALAEQGLLSV